MISTPLLFRSSRPDYIETLGQNPFKAQDTLLFRSSRPDYIETAFISNAIALIIELFRSSRPDYIETLGTGCHGFSHTIIVPVFQAGLH